MIYAQDSAEQDMIWRWGLNLLNTAVTVARVSPQGTCSACLPTEQPEYPTLM